jgi:hypothetical protein
MHRKNTAGRYIFRQKNAKETISEFVFKPMPVKNKDRCFPARPKDLP